MAIDPLHSLSEHELQLTDEYEVEKGLPIDCGNIIYMWIRKIQNGLGMRGLKKPGEDEQQQ